ncbi:MAG: transporter substrate-binding domain-containing protein [Clostridiaceae bacterium]
MKTRKIIAMLMALCVLMAFGGCSNNSTSEGTPTATPTVAPTATSSAAPTASAAPVQEEKLGTILKEIKETGVLKVGVFGNRPPWYFQVVDSKGNTKIVGFEYSMIQDVAALCAQKLGRTVKIDIMDADVAGVLAAIQAGKVHFGLSLAPTAERRQNMDFSSISYHRSLQVIAIRVKDKDNPMFDPAKKLKGVKIAGIQGSSTSITLKEQYPDCELVDLTSASDELLSLVNGKVDGAVFNEKIGILYAKANPEIMVDYDLAYKIPVERDPGSAIAFAYGNDDFKVMVSDYIKRILEDGTFANYEKQAILALDDPTLLEGFATKNLIDTSKK